MKDDYFKVAVFVALGIIVKNANTYSSYLLQITNRIDKYVVVTISCRVIYGITVVILLLLKVSAFEWYCGAELGSECCAVLIASRFNKGLYFTPGNPFNKTALQELKLNIAGGMLLMFANWSSSLLVGGAKMVIQWRWNEFVFGKAVFAFSLSSIFLTFITAISVVLFPSLKRMDEKELPALYERLRDGTSFLMFFVLIGFFPGCKILELWMPKYRESLIYLGILLPSIVFLSKISLLTNNYFKAYRAEKQMMIINVAATVIAFLSYLLSAYVLNNMTVLLLVLVFVIMGRSVVSEIAVGKIIRKTFTKDYLIEAVMCVAFIWIARNCKLGVGFLLYSIMYIFYIFINFNRSKALLRK